MIEKLYTVEEVAELASVTGRTIRNYLKSGRLVGRKIGGQWRFPESEVQRLLTGADLEMAPEAPETHENTAEASAAPTFPMEAEVLSAPAASAPAASPVPTQESAPVSTNYVAPAPLPSPTPPPEPMPATPVVEESATVQENRPSPQASAAPESIPAPQAPAPEPVYRQPPSHVSYDYAQNFPPMPQAPVASVQASAPEPFYQTNEPAFAQQPPTYATPPLAQAPVQPAVQPAVQTAAQAGAPAAQAPAAPVAAPEPPEYAHSNAVYPWPSARPEAGAPPMQIPYYPLYGQSPLPPAAYYPGVFPVVYPPVQQAPELPAETDSTPPPPVAKPELPAEEKPDEPLYAPPKERSEPVAAPELSDVGKRVTKFISEVHDCSHGPLLCAVMDLHQSLSSAKHTSERLADIAQQESETGILCQSFVEFDERYYVARYTLFGSSSFLYRCLKLIG